MHVPIQYHATSMTWSVSFSLRWHNWKWIDSGVHLGGSSGAERRSGAAAEWVNGRDERWSDALPIHERNDRRPRRVAETMSCSNESVIGICWRESYMILSVRGHHTGGTRCTRDRNKKGPTVISFDATIIRSLIFCIFNTVLFFFFFSNSLLGWLKCPDSDIS